MEGQDGWKNRKTDQISLDISSHTWGFNYEDFMLKVQYSDFPVMEAFLMPGVTQKETRKFISVLLLGYWSTNFTSVEINDISWKGASIYIKLIFERFF